MRVDVYKAKNYTLYKHSHLSSVSRAKSAVSLVTCVNPGVAVVKYSYEATTLTRLLQLVGATLKGRQALSIAMVVHGQPGYFKICSQKVCVCVQTTWCVKCKQQQTTGCVKHWVCKVQLV